MKGFDEKLTHKQELAVAALLTGNSVQSLSVAMNASGETYTTQGGMFSRILVSSAGYLGAMTFGALLLVLIRKAVAARIVLAGSAVLILLLTTVFGLIKPLLAGSWGSLSGIPFTFFAGIVLAVGLFAVARFASARVATFVLRRQISTDGSNRKTSSTALGIRLASAQSEAHAVERRVHIHK